MSWGVNNGGFIVNFSVYMFPLLPLMLIILVLNQRQIRNWFLALLGLVVLFSILDPDVNNPANVSRNVVFENTYMVIVISWIFIKRSTNSSVRRTMHWNFSRKKENDPNRCC